MNKLNKFLSIFISILTVCSGLLPSAPVFAQDSSTSNEYIYRGWKEYQNSYDQAFYVGLKDKVISEREIEDRHVAYCFNYGKPAPLDLKNPEEILYKKVNLNENNMYLYINNPESQKENYKEFYKNIMKVIYNGYPENAAGIKEDLNDGDFREATQWAVWFYTDKYNPEQDQKLIALLPLMSEGARAIWDKKIAAYKKLIGGGIVDTGNFSLDMYETNMKSSDGKKYQNLIALKKNDPKKRPEDETQYKTQVSFAKITDEEYEKLKKEKPDIYSIKGLSGVKLKIEEVDGKEICKFESKSNAGYSHELTSGKEYKLIELEAPEGYKKAEPVSFRIEEEIEMLYGFPQLKFKIYIKGANGQWEEAADNAVVMVDEKQQTTPVEPQTPEPDKTSLKVEKEWQGIDPNDAPEVTVYLVKNKEKTKESIKLNKDNKWKGEFKDLEVVDDINDNKANVYTIVEDGEEDGKVTLADTEYEVTYAGGKVINTKIVPQMSLEPAKKSLKVEKEWQGINPNDAPEVTVYLVKNDKKTDKAIKLNKDNKWKGEFEELEAVDNINDNKANVYTIVEAGEEKGKVMLADTEYKVTYAGGKVINTKVVSKTKVSFSKKALTENGEELAGAKIKLTKKDDTTEEGTTVIKEWVTDGKLTEFELEAGSYTFTEISAPDKYQVATAITFEVKDGKVIVKNKEVSGNTIVMVDELKEEVVPATPEKTKVKFSKKALTENGEELAGAKIKLTKKDDTTEEGTTVIKEWVTDGKLTEFELEAGSYTFTEISAPDKYQVATAITFEVKDGKVIVKNKEVSGNTIVMVDELKEEVVPATPEKTKVKFSKKALTENGEELKGATIKLTKENGTVIKEWVTDGKLTEFELEAGSYTFTEISAPDKYQVATAITFEVKDGKVIVKNKEVSGNTIVMVDELKEVPVTPEKTKVKFSKKALTENGEELAGAKIKLTKKDDTTEEGTTVIKEWVTDGKLTEFELEAGSYTFTEISAPDKYQVATAITFEVKAGKVLVTGTEVKGNTIVMVDKLKEEVVPVTPEKTKVKFSKKALTANGEELKGAKIKLTKKDGTTVREWITDGKLTEFELEAGSYTFTEVSAPDKYQVATAITFEVKDGKVLVTGTEVKGNTIVMVDKLKEKVVPVTPEKTKVKFSKKALTANGEELKGATIKLTKENGTVIKEWVTDGKLTEFELEDGSYTFTEISAPDKYQVATAITFEVKAGKVLVTGTEVKGNTIVMVDKLKKTPITHLSTPTTQNIEKMRALNTSINNTLPKTGAGASLSPYGIFMGLLGTLLITIELRKRRKEN